MIQLPYSLTIEATGDPAFFSYFSPDLAGFSGTGASIEQCIEQAHTAMAEHIEVMRLQQLPVPTPNPHPRILIENAKPTRAA